MPGGSRSSELVLLDRVLWKTKNQYRRTIFYKRMCAVRRHVKRLFLRPGSNATSSNRAIGAIQTAFVYLDANLELTHFMPLSLVCIGILGRLFRLCSDFEKNSRASVENNAVAADPFDDVGTPVAVASGNMGMASSSSCMESKPISSSLPSKAGKRKRKDPGRDEIEDIFSVLS